MLTKLEKYNMKHVRHFWTVHIWGQPPTERLTDQPINQTTNEQTNEQTHSLTHSLTNYKQKSPSWESKSFSDSQEIPCILQNTKNWKD